MTAEKKDIFHLLSRASKADSLQEIADLAYEILGNPVFIEDRAQVKLAYSQNVTIEQPEWKRGVMENLYHPLLLHEQLHEMTEAYKGSIKSHKPVVVEDSHIPYPRLIKTLTIRGAHVGTMVATGFFKPITETEVELMDILASFVITNIQKSNYTLSANKRAIENFLIRLFNGEVIAPEIIQEYEKLLRWKEYPYHHVLAICSVGGGENETHSLKEIAKELSHIPHSYPLIYDNSIVYLYNSDHLVNKWQNENPSLLSLLQKMNLTAGVSQNFPELRELHRYFLQARCMIEVASTIKNEYSFFDYNENAIYHMMNLMPQDLALKEFCHQKILFLEGYDRKYHTDLVPTLHIYLETFKSISRTAEIMKIHRNTVSYRINRCFELLDANIEDNNEMFSFILSLRIIEYANKKRGHFPPHQKK